MATRQEIKQYPTRTNQIPRHIPPPHWASHPFVLFLAAGLLPFGTIFVELYFAMTSIWQVCPVPQLPLMLEDEPVLTANAFLVLEHSTACSLTTSSNVPVMPLLL